MQLKLRVAWGMITNLEEEASKAKGGWTEAGDNLESLRENAEYRGGRCMREERLWKSILPEERIHAGHPSLIRDPKKLT